MAARSEPEAEISPWAVPSGRVALSQQGACWGRAEPRGNHSAAVVVAGPTVRAVVRDTGVCCDQSCSGMCRQCSASRALPNASR